MLENLSLHRLTPSTSHLLAQDRLRYKKEMPTWTQNSCADMGMNPCNTVGGPTEGSYLRHLSSVCLRPAGLNEPTACDTHGAVALVRLRVVRLGTACQGLNPLEHTWWDEMKWDEGHHWERIARKWSTTTTSLITTYLDYLKTNLPTSSDVRQSRSSHCLYSSSLFLKHRQWNKKWATQTSADRGLHPHPCLRLGIWGTEHVDCQGINSLCGKRKKEHLWIKKNH